MKNKNSGIKDTRFRRKSVLKVRGDQRKFNPGLLLSAYAF